MGYEIDFRAVGKESQSGDAIALRYGNLHGPRNEQRVIVIDGGFSDDGAALVKHIRTYYETDLVDVVVSTHPDQDHVSGLVVVLEEIQVSQLWMHLPWKHSDSLAEGRKAATRFSGFTERLQKALAGASDLAELAEAKGITIFEPFAGLSIDSGKFKILGPTQALYEQLIAEIKHDSLAALTGAVQKMVQAAKRLFARETLIDETLTEDGETTPQNETSAICLLNTDGQYALLTGDAGQRALDPVVSTLEEAGLAKRMNFVQVPHHGSRRNVGPTILDRLLGDKGTTDARGVAFVSAAANGSPKHPSKKVTNAFRRRGYPVHATQGEGKLHRFNAPPRNWTASEPLPLYDSVEDDTAS